MNGMLDLQYLKLNHNAGLEIKLEMKFLLQPKD